MDIERQVDLVINRKNDSGYKGHKQFWLSLGTAVVAFMLGTMLVLPVFGGRNGLELLQEFLESNDDIPIITGAETTYYFNAYDSGVEEWELTPEKMVNGDIADYAKTDVNADIELCNGNTCDGTDLGTITKVEIRAYAAYYGAGDIYLRPVFDGSEDGNNYELNIGAAFAWSGWQDVTNDYSGSWDSWTRIQNLDCDVESLGIGTFQYVECGKVEIRVNYTVRTPTLVFNYWFACGNETDRNPTEIFNYYFICGNGSRTPTQVFNYWFACGNGTRTPTIIFNNWFSCGNATTRESTEIFNYWFQCSNESSRTPTNIFDYYFICGNGTRTLVQVFDYWFSCGNGSRTPVQVFDYYFACGNVSTARTPTAIFNYWFSCGNTTSFEPTPSDGYTLTWNETLTTLCAYISDAQGDNIYYEIRQDGNVLENGSSFVYTNTTHNFTDTVNNSASWESGKSSMSSGIALTATTEFTSSEYTNISSVNGSGVNTSDCSPEIWSHHNFSFDLSGYTIRDITGLEVRWYGYGGYYTGGAKPKWNWGTTMYFDTDAAGWYTASNTTPYTTDDWSPVLEWINYSAHHDMIDWIDADNILNVAVEHTSAYDCSVIYTDYIELIVTTISGGVGNGTYCTSNVSFWNDNCGVEWTWSVYIDDGHGVTSTTTYTFNNAPCVFSGTVYPVSGVTGVCPCCDPICVDVTADYNFNMTVYGREQGGSIWYVWNSYIDIPADEYCFCMDGIMPTIKIHAVAHSHTIHTVDIVDMWYNVTFDDGDFEGIEATPATGIVVIPSYGHYTATYWAAVTDDSVNPVGNHMAIRVIQNGTDEVDGSYRETEFSTKEKEQHLTGSIHNVFYPGTTLRFQYIGDDTDQKINITDTWSDDNICFYAYIEKTSPVEESNPMQFNTTYEWYVNVSKYDNSSLYNQTSVFSFTTAVNRSDCVVSASVGGGGRNSYVLGVIGLCGLFSIPVSYVLYIKLKKRRETPVEYQNMRSYRRNNWD